MKPKHLQRIIIIHKCNLSETFSSLPTEFVISISLSLFHIFSPTCSFTFSTSSLQFPCFKHKVHSAHKTAICFSFQIEAKRNSAENMFVCVCNVYMWCDSINIEVNEFFLNFIDAFLHTKHKFNIQQKREKKTVKKISWKS